jgi:hypothetical protein
MFVNVSGRFAIVGVRSNAVSGLLPDLVRMDRRHELLLRRYDCRTPGEWHANPARLPAIARIDPIGQTVLPGRIAGSKPIGRTGPIDPTERIAQSDRTFDRTVMRFDQNGEKQRDLTQRVPRRARTGPRRQSDRV